MATSSLSFAKIVATPTDTAWAQAYNEGSVFVVLSLTKTADIEPESLPTIGKEVLSIFRAEFFGLEEKSLIHFKTAAHKSFEHVPSSILSSFVMAFNKDDLLYLVVIGGGKVIIKRKEKTGILMDHAITEPSLTAHTASGVLQSQDIVLLQTQDFAKEVTEKQLEEALSTQLPNDMAEILSPGIHNKDQGAAACLILSFHGVAQGQIPEDEEDDSEEVPVPVKAPPVHEEPAQTPVEEDKEPQAVEEEMPLEKEENSTEEKKRFSLALPSLPKRSRLLIGIVGLLVILLIGSIIFTKHNQEQTKNKKIFDEIYTSALSDYDEGMNLVSLNKSLARDDFLQAQKTLEKGKGVFKEGTEEKKKYDELKKKVEDQLGGAATTQSVKAEEVSLDEAPLLKAANEKTDYTAFSEEDNTVYAANNTNVFSVTDEDILVTSDGDWASLKGLSVYSGNIYLLDSKAGILKFVPSGTEYASSTYFKGEKPDFSKAVALAIDSSIYVLFSDGSIQKFTKGAPDTFTVKGIPTPLSSPTRIFTGFDFKKIYILDPQSARIVILNKNGEYEKEISSSVLKDAKEFTIDELEEHAFVLSNKKAYSIPIK